MERFLYFTILFCTFQVHAFAAANDIADPLIDESTVNQDITNSDASEPINQEMTDAKVSEPLNQNNSDSYATEPTNQNVANPDVCQPTYQHFGGYTFYQSPTNQHFVSIRRNQGRSIISNSSYTTLEAFSFPYQFGNIYPFVDLRYHHFDNSENAVNVGFGVRYQAPCSCMIYGVNAYYDYRTTCHSGFNQFGLGFEVLGEIWNFRLNGYLPAGNKSQRCSFCYFDDYEGDYFFLHEKFRDSLRGVNFEIEAMGRDCCGNELGLAIGPYYYNRSRGCNRDIYGSQLRLTSGFCNYFSFIVLASYDNVFKGRVQAQLGLTLPFYFQQCDDGRFHVGNSNPRLYQRVQRNDAPIVKSRNRWSWNF